MRWYLRFGLSYRDVEELLAERGIEVDHVTVYRWVQRFTPLLAGRGLLFAGHSENFHYVAGGLLRTLGHTVYAPMGADR